MIYAGAAVNWLKEIMYQFTAARSWRSNPGLQQAVDVSRNLTSIMALKTHILRLGSVVANGVGGPEAGFIDFLYSYYLQEFGQDRYSHIHINQIGDDLHEIILKGSKSAIDINIRYPARVDFLSLNSMEQNLIRLDVVHMALLRIAEYEGKLSIESLKKIRTQIIDSNFSLSVLYRNHVLKSNPILNAEVVIVPEAKCFKFYCKVFKNGLQVCNLLIYTGLTQDFYIDRYFCYGKWKGEDLLVISGKEKIVEIHVLVKENRFEIVNLTPYKNPPFFQLSKAGLAQEDKLAAIKDWEHSLPPAVASIIKHEPN